MCMMCLFKLKGRLIMIIIWADTLETITVIISIKKPSGKQPITVTVKGVSLRADLYLRHQAFFYLNEI